MLGASYWHIHETTKYTLCWNNRRCGSRFHVDSIPADHATIIVIVLGICFLLILAAGMVYGRFSSRADRRSPTISMEQMSRATHVALEHSGADCSARARGEVRTHMHNLSV